MSPTRAIVTHQIPINILISHDGRDQGYANSLKMILEKVFPRLSVYVSGTSTKAGQIWVEDLIKNLRSAHRIITLLSKTSLDNKWVLFESGAGFQNGRTIPLLMGDLDSKDIEPPLSFLHALRFDHEGLKELLKELGRQLSLPLYTNEKDQKRLFWEAEKLIAKPKLEYLRNFAPKVNSFPKIYDGTDGYCLMYEFPIEEGHRLAIDVVFQLDTTEIQFFGRDTPSSDHLWNKILKNKTFLPKPLDKYPKNEDRLIFASLSSTAPIEDVKTRLTTLVERIQTHVSNSSSSD